MVDFFYKLKKQNGLLYVTSRYYKLRLAFPDINYKFRLGLISKYP